MTLQLAAQNPGANGVRRTLCEHVRNALHALAQRQSPADEAIHEARKALKRARANLRLLHGALSDAAYRRDDDALRDAARPLSRVRDARVLIDTLDRLIARFGERVTCLPLERFRQLLSEERAQVRSEVLGRDNGISIVRASLRANLRRAERLGLNGDGWDALGPSLKHIYANGRRGYQRALDKPTTEALHGWRKHVKYLWHALQSLRPLWPGVVGELAGQAHRLSEHLGDDHDLSVLREKFLETPSAMPDAAAASALVALIERRRAELQDAAFALGVRLYEEKPKDFETRFAEYWRNWSKESAPSGNGRAAPPELHVR